MKQGYLSIHAPQFAQYLRDRGIPFVFIEEPNPLNCHWERIGYRLSQNDKIEITKEECVGCDTVRETYKTGLVYQFWLAEILS